MTSPPALPAGPAGPLGHYWLRAFPLVLRRRREERGLCRSALAEAAGLTLFAMIDLEEGRVRPDLDVLVTLSDALEVAVEDLLHDTRRTAEALVLGDLRRHPAGENPGQRTGRPSGG